jgi:D-aspartate ligase
MTTREHGRVPALILKVGQYPLHSGGVAAVRTLGRLGVPVYVTSEDPLTPAALSRYAAGHFRWRTTGHEDPADLVDGLTAVGRQIGEPSVLVPVDDEAAVLIAEHADELSGHFLFPRIRPGLSRQLASKHELFSLCRQHGMPAPESVYVSSAETVAAFAQTATFPVVAKNAEPWVRRRAPAVAGTTVLRSAAELTALAAAADGSATFILQDYVPHDQAEDWIVHLYCDAGSNCLVLFTGVKLRSWPPNTGATASGIAVANPALAELAGRFCKAVGFHGVADLDVRYDRRDGQYKLVDFNPRMGNQFRLFQTAAGIDVLRALYLDMTGQDVPPGDQVNGRRIVVEHIDLFARIGQRGSGYAPSSAPRRASSTELAWLAADDPLPFVAMLPRLASLALSDISRRRRRAWRRKHAKNGAHSDEQHGD